MPSKGCAVSSVETPVATSDVAVAPSPWRRGVALITNQQAILLLVLVAVMCFFDFHNGRFFGSAEFSNLIVDFSLAVLIAVAETYVIISGGIDLSVGSTIAISGVVGAYAIQYMQSHHFGELGSLLLGTIVCAGIGAVIGTINAI